MKKIISIIISIILAFSLVTTASAATVTSLVAAVNTDTDRTVSVTVTYANPEDAQESTLLVVKQGASIVTATKDELFYIDQKVVDGNTATYSFKMAEKDRVGTYDLYTGGTAIDAPASTQISFDTDATLTLKFVDSTGVEIASQVIVSTSIGTSIDLSLYAKDTITYGTGIYKKDDTNPTTYTATSATGALTITYTYQGEKPEEFIYDGLSYTAVTDNLIYNGDMSETTNDGTYTYVTGWQGGYVNAVHNPLSNRPYLYEAGGSGSTADSHFIYTEATDSENAYITTPARGTMTSSSWGTYPWKSDVSENYMAFALTSWMMDASDVNTYLKAESGKMYYMSFDMMATTIASVNNVVGFTAVSENGDTYASKIPGTNGDINTLTWVLDNSIGRNKYTTTANEWVTVETVATATDDGYFMFQLGWAHEYGQVSLANFKIYEVEESDTNKEITVTYTVDGAAVHSESQTINTASVTKTTFGEYYYAPNGTNTMYYAESRTISDSVIVEMTKLDNYSQYAVGTQFESGCAWYEVTGTNMIPNSHFDYDINGWYNGSGNGATDTYFTVSDNVLTAKGGTGSGGDAGLYRAWDIVPGNTYALIFDVSSDVAWGTVKEQNSATRATDEVKTLIADGGIKAGTNLIAFKAEGEYLAINAGWLASHTFSQFGLYEVKEIDYHTITLNVLNEDGEIIGTYAVAVLPDGTGTITGEEIVNGGKYYTFEDQTYTNVTEDAAYEIYATVDSTKYASVESYTWNFTDGEDISSTLEKGNISGLSDTLMTIAWGDTRQGIVNFNVPAVNAKQLESATLTLYIGGQQGDNVAFNVYAMPNSKSPKVSGVSDSSSGVLVGSYSASLGSDYAVDAVATIPLTFSDYIDTSNGLTFRLEGTSQMVVMWGAEQGAKAPVLSDVAYTDISATAVTVNCVDESGNTLQTGTQYFTSFYGYDDELLYPGTEIPSIDGYLFKSKSVAEGVITLTYAVDSQDDYFFDNITDMNTRFVSLNMLGSHDAFTDGISSIKYDAAGVAQGDTGSVGATIILGSSVAVALSKAQDLTPLGQLQAGARYFDVRLSRSTADADAGTVYYNAPHTNGVIYTTHGVLGEEFEPVLTSIAQWAKTHPGEIIVLDFQEFFDDGDATSQSWKDLNSLLSSTGILEYVTVGNGAIKDITYGTLTENGTKCGIVLFGRAVATNASVGNFILRGDTSGAFNGKVYSNYETGLDTTIGTSFNADYIQAQVDYIENGTVDDYHPVHSMFRVMQAQSESKSNLLTQASSDNTNLYTSLTNNPEWLTVLPVVMVNRVGTNTDDIVTLLRSCNVPTVTVNYVDENGAKVKSVENGALVGTLYTNDGFYDEPLYKLVAGSDGEYYVAETFYTTGDVTKVISNSGVDVTVTKLGNAYTSQNGKVYVNQLTDDGAYMGTDNFGAFNWGTAPADRVGVAVLSAVADKSAYVLSATEARKYFNTSAGSTKLYAIPVSTYRSLDLYDQSSVISYMTDEYLVATLTHGNCGEATTSDVEIVLDSEKIASIAKTGDVVILGDSVNGLYALSGSTMEIVSGYNVTTITNGVEVTKVIDGTYTLPEGAIAYYDEDATKLYEPSEEVEITNDTTFVGYTSLGVKMVDGAQVRIGDGVDSEGKVGTGSGLRFITTVDRNDTLVSLDEEIEMVLGVEIAAENSQNTAKIEAKQWQTANEVFTSALTNLAVGNYNRNFTATPYIIADGKTFYGDGVTRSIYTVAAGLLAKGYSGGDYGQDSDNSGTDYNQMSEILIKVLNAYVNQTGIRLTFTDVDASGGYTDGDTLTVRTSGTGAYTSDAFFEVSATTYSDGVYSVTLTPIGDNTKINMDYWNEYVRINNNNSAIKAKVTLTENTDGTYTLKFDTN